MRKSTMYPTTNTACGIPRTCYACIWVGPNNIIISISCPEKVYSNWICIKAINDNISSVEVEHADHSQQEKMELLNLEMEQRRYRQEQIRWRRDKVQELSSKEYNQREIASYLKIGIGTVNRDLMYLRQQVKENIKKYVDGTLPEEYNKCLVGLNSILKEAWSVSQQANDSRIEKIKALMLAKECYAMKLELLTNATVVNDAMRFVSSHTVGAKTEKYNAQYHVTLDKDGVNDIQRLMKVIIVSSQPHGLHQQTTLFSSKILNKPFWIWDIKEHKEADILTNGYCCFNHIIGLPKKNGEDKPFYDYERILFDTLHQLKHVWIKKATGLGITEFMLRYMAWLCLRNHDLNGTQMCIVTGPRIDLAITLIDRMKRLFTE